MTHPSDPSEIDTVNAEASTLMKRGISLMETGDAGDVTEALACFDRAIEWRRSLPIDAVPTLGYGLAACWLNRADALMRLAATRVLDGTSGADPFLARRSRDAAEAAGPRVEQIVLAVAAFDEALTLLRNLPLGEDPRYPRRLAIAYQNRGLALIAQGDAGAADAIASFTEAIAVIEHEQGAPIADRTYLLAAIWMNLANALVPAATADSDSRAHAAARRALSLVRDLEGEDADAVDVGLKARHVICRVLARRLSSSTEDREALTNNVHEATDLVDEGLALIQQWEQRHVARFRDIAGDLFRFGVGLYGTFQPHFVEDFVRENTDPARSSPEYVESMVSS